MSLKIDRRRFVISTALAPFLLTKANAEAPAMVVHKTSTCGCCGAWVDHMRKAGFALDVKDVTQEDLNSIKSRLGIRPELASCHTAVIDGYFVEGHVPAEDVKRLLSERPAGSGLSVPGMPVGSPGMEMGSQKDPFDTILIGKNGETTVFAKHR